MSICLLLIKYMLKHILSFMVLNLYFSETKHFIKLVEVCFVGYADINS